jgi:hypothetical protein
MSFEMRPRTEPGARLLAAIRDVAPLLSEREEEADRNNQICEQNYRGFCCHRRSFILQSEIDVRSPLSR